jgi:hypothetical protein
MLKRLFKKFRGDGNNKYAIQVLVKNGQATYLPVVKESSFGSKWTPIIKVYDLYLAMDVEKPGGLTEEECKEHIEGCKNQIAMEKAASELTISYKEM